MSSPAQTLIDAIDAFRQTPSSTTLVFLEGQLDGLSRRLAKEEQLRYSIGLAELDLWPRLEYVWSFVDAETSAGTSLETLGLSLAVYISRFTRNVVAGVPSNQEKAFVFEPYIRHLVHKFTSFYETQDEKKHPLTRLLTQTLANIVTANEIVLSRFWKTHMTLTEDQNVLMRLLQYPDVGTIISTLVLVLNSVHGSEERSKILCTSPIGLRLCVFILDKAAQLFDAEETSDEGKSFEISYRVFKELFQHGQAKNLWEGLADSEEIITSHQTILVKLLDSYLQSAECADPIDYYLFLPSTLLALLRYAQSWIRAAISESTAATPPAPPDSRLPALCEQLVVLSQCLVSVLMREQEGSNSQYILLQCARTTSAADGQGSIESLIETLRLLDIFLPRVVFGKASPHFASFTPSVESAASDPTGFSYLKRDLVRLLSILCHDDRLIQDRIRECGGIPVVMNLCVVDERNPYLREHALFALRNLLHGNKENQAIVDAMQPLGEWGDDGILRDKPGGTRK